MGETRVDLHHLLEDLRDAYPGALEETILTEIVANCLDSGARTIVFATSPADATLTVMDDGSGMQRRELTRYHDIAATSKTRGEGIGFAGVGIKLGLLLCEEVITESRRGKTHVATRWHLASRHKAPWKWIPPPGRVIGRGTAVALRLNNALSPLLDAGYIETVLRRHFEPLLDSTFADFLAPQYGQGVRLKINGRPVDPETPKAAEIVRIEVKLARRRKPSAVGYLVRESGALPEDRRGVAVSTMGKVIKRGWDWLGLTPDRPDSIGGLVEIPDLANSLTLNKADFIRTGTRGATYLAYRRALQQAVSAQFAAWGDRRTSDQTARRRWAAPMERDLERILVDLADEFPLVGTLVERRFGGQRRLPIGGAPIESGRALVSASLSGQAEEPPSQASRENAAAAEPSQANPSPQRTQPEAVIPPTPALPGTPAGARAQRYGLRVEFESRPGDLELGRLVESTVWVNEAHPAYLRAVDSRSEGYHLALTVAMALSPLAAEAASEKAFLTSFLARWGDSVRKASGVSRSRGRRALS